MNIFTITLINTSLDDKINSTDSRRCIGYYENKSDAIRAVIDNKGEMHECLYNYIVIEEIPSGVWASTISETWYEWNFPEKRWEKIDKPLKYRKFGQVVGFGVG